MSSDEQFSSYSSSTFSPPKIVWVFGVIMLVGVFVLIHFLTSYQKTPKTATNIDANGNQLTEKGFPKLLKAAIPVPNSYTVVINKKRAF